MCKQWKKEVERILKNREQLGWVSYNYYYDTAPDGGHDEHELGHFGRNLDECIQVYRAMYVCMCRGVLTRYIGLEAG